MSAVEITEELFDSIAAPIAAAVALAMLDTQLEVLREVEGQVAENLAAWDAGMRERAVTDFGRSISEIRAALDGFEAILAEGTS